MNGTLPLLFSYKVKRLISPEQAHWWSIAGTWVSGTSFVVRPCPHSAVRPWGHMWPTYYCAAISCLGRYISTLGSEGYPKLQRTKSFLWKPQLCIVEKWWTVSSPGIYTVEFFSKCVFRFVVMLGTNLSFENSCSTNMCLVIWSLRVVLYFTKQTDILDELSWSLGK